MDFNGIHSRLIWANEREVEAKYLDVGETRGGTDSVVWFIKRGSVEISYRNGVTRATAGQWIFLRAENGHQHFEDGSAVISIRFHLRLRGGKLLYAPARDIVLDVSEHPGLTSSAKALVEANIRVNSTGTLWTSRMKIPLVENFRIESAFMNWLAEYVAALEWAGERPVDSGERDERVVSALAYIEEHRMRDKFTEADLARHCGLSINQLARVFQRETGLSPFQYYESLRLEFAKHAISETELPMKEIAFELGFSSAAHFSNWFTRKVRHSPRAYRLIGSQSNLAWPQGEVTV
ncbi:hypothetical protein GCM10007047_33500 [Cerasicoccus arenae]|uniref:HTH araC/xylS-type domain-containing protein n=2 Tax=Cerasicoccus arenae TaxID=424488 RepID=A0A8J3DF17_9BACT|nr:hypothetical protein GCM10007047_33500 [Cerasicoccus arenae]